MKIVGCDFHPSWQQVAVFDPETGEIVEHKLVNGNGEAERFYRELELPALADWDGGVRQQSVVYGVGGAVGPHQVWIGDAAQIRASYVRKQKTDRAMRRTF
jgi:transposase